MTEEQLYQQGMYDAYHLMDKTVAGAIKRNDGARTAMQVLNVFNEFTAHLHYQQSLLKDQLRTWDTEENGEFTDIIGEIQDFLNSIELITIKGGRA